jgi:rhodanese-related sulfurtransferase
VRTRPQATPVEHEARRIDEATFLRWRAEPGTVVLDVRSGALVARRHAAGAVVLPFIESAADTRARDPRRATRAC